MSKHKLTIKTTIRSISQQYLLVKFLASIKASMMAFNFRKIICFQHILLKLFEPHLLTFKKFSARKTACVEINLFSPDSVMNKQSNEASFFFIFFFFWHSLWFISFVLFFLVLKLHSSLFSFSSYHSLWFISFVLCSLKLVMGILREFQFHMLLQIVVELLRTFKIE